MRAIIYQNEMKEPQIVPVTDQCAYFELFSNDYVILFEDSRGYRYVKKHLIQTAEADGCREIP